MDCDIGGGENLGSLAELRYYKNMISIMKVKYITY